MPTVDLKEMVRGDTYGITMNFKTKDGTPIDVEGRKLTFTMKHHWSEPDVDSAIQKVVDLVAPDVSAQNGQAYILLSTVETDVTPSKYVYDIQMVNGAIVTTLLKGNILVSGDITQGV